MNAGTGLILLGDKCPSGKLFVRFLVLRGNELVLLDKLRLGDVVPDVLGVVGALGEALNNASSDFIARIPEACAGTTSPGARISHDFLRSVGVAGSSSIGGKSELFTFVLLLISCTRSILIAGTCAGSLMLVWTKRKIHCKFLFEESRSNRRDAMNRSSSNINNRSSGTFDVKAHNFGLFSLVKILSVSSGSKAKPKGKIDANSLNNKQDVTIDVVAQGGYLGHEFLALYCSNGN